MYHTIQSKVGIICLLVLVIAHLLCPQFCLAREEISAPSRDSGRAYYHFLVAELLGNEGKIDLVDRGIHESISS